MELDYFPLSKGGWEGVTSPEPWVFDAYQDQRHRKESWHQQSFTKYSFQITYSWTYLYSTNTVSPVLTAKSKSIMCKWDCASCFNCALGVLSENAFAVIHTLRLWQQFVTVYSLQWPHFLVICFHIFFALACKPFWSILHPNTFKNHPR